MKVNKHIIAFVTLSVLLVACQKNNLTMSSDTKNLSKEQNVKTFVINNSGKTAKKFVKKDTKIVLDETTQVLLDSPQIQKDDIVKVIKHGDHWHIFTKAGKEYISYKDPATISDSDDLSKIASETQKYTPEQIVEHTKKIYLQDNSIVIKWLHIDHYHDSIYGVSEDIEGVTVKEAPKDYVIDSSKEIASEVLNKRYFKYGNTIYFVDGVSQVTFDTENTNEEDDIKANEIVPNIESIYTKKGKVVIKWLHKTNHAHYHESILGISNDIKNVKVVDNVSINYVKDMEKIPSYVDNKLYYRKYGKDADTIYILKTNKKVEKQSQKDKDSQLDNTEDSEETDISATDVVPNIKKIYEKNKEIVIKWLHKTKHPHYHESIIGISDDIADVTIEEIYDKEDTKGLIKIPSVVRDRKYYRNKGKDASTIYFLVEEKEYKENKKDNTSKHNTQINDTKKDNIVSDKIADKKDDKVDNNSNDTKTENNINSDVNNEKIEEDTEENISASEIVPNIEEISLKKNLVVIKWLHKTENAHYHESVMGISEDIKNVKIENVKLDKVTGYEEIKSNVLGKKYYRQVGNLADTVYVVDIQNKIGIFDDVINYKDKYIVKIDDKEYILTKKEYEMAQIDKKYTPVNKDFYDTNSDLYIEFYSGEIVIDEDKNPKYIISDSESISLEASYIHRQDGQGQVMEDKDPNFAGFNWYISYPDSNEWNLIAENTASLDEDLYEISDKDNGGLLKVAIMSKDGSIITQAVYNIIIGDPNDYKPKKDVNISKHTLEIIANTRRIFYKNGEEAIQWWHINHWHYEPFWLHNDLIVEPAPLGYKISGKKAPDENDSKYYDIEEVLGSEIQSDIPNKRFFIEKDRIYYIEEDITATPSNASHN